MDRKGIDMVFKGANKKYPFLVDWFMDSDSDMYKSIIPINLIINREMVCKHFGYNPHQGFVKKFVNFSWVMDCDAITGDDIYEEIYRYFTNGYTMIPPEYCELSEVFNTGLIKKLTVSLIHLDDYDFPEPDSLRS